MLASAQALFKDIRGGGLEKPYWEAIRPEKSMHRYLRICIDACGTEQIPGSPGLLCPTEFINKEKGSRPVGQRIFWSYSQGNWPGQETPLLPLYFSIGVLIKIQGEKDVFVRNFLGFPGLYSETQRCFGQITSFISVLWYTIESHSGGRNYYLWHLWQKNISSEKCFLENSLVFHWP